MTTQSKTVIKSYFETGDVPTEAEFIDLVDSYGLFLTFTLTANLVPGSPATGTCDLFFADTGVSYLTARTVIFNTYDDLLTGDTGSCLELNGKYYAVSLKNIDAGPVFPT